MFRFKDYNRILFWKLGIWGTGFENASSCWSDHSQATRCWNHYFIDTYWQIGKTKREITIFERDSGRSIDF